MNNKSQPESDTKTWLFIAKEAISLAALIPIAGYMKAIIRLSFQLEFPIAVPLSVNPAHAAWDGFIILVALSPAVVIGHRFLIPRNGNDRPKFRLAAVFPATQRSLFAFRFKSLSVEKIVLLIVSLILLPLNLLVPILRGLFTLQFMAFVSRIFKFYAPNRYLIELGLVAILVTASTFLLTPNHAQSSVVNVDDNAIPSGRYLLGEAGDWVFLRKCGLDVTYQIPTSNVRSIIIKSEEEPLLSFSPSVLSIVLGESRWSTCDSG